MSFGEAGKKRGGVPGHIAIIMDGNGRWALKNSMARAMGHKAGAKTMRDISRFCRDIGVGMLTLFAFSTENWKRPADEVDAIMELLVQYLNDALVEAPVEDTEIRIIGDRGPLREDIKELITRVESISKGGAFKLNVAVNYGGRAEILSAASSLMQDARMGRFAAGITEADFAARLYTAGMPDPDLIIRPSGEKRISNFLLWQCAYSEFYFVKTLWPDFKPKHIRAAIEEYEKRSRRFGGTGPRGGA